jgi:hypothetical protein
MRYQHTKLFEDWLLERDLSSPIFIEMEAGNIKVYADPQKEDWRGESARAEMYEEKKEKLDHAVKNNDDESMKLLLRDLRDSPLFAQDTSNEWRTAQIDGVEFSQDYAAARKNLSMYTIRKIGLFLDWVKQRS